LVKEGRPDCFLEMDGPDVPLLVRSKSVRCCKLQTVLADTVAKIGRLGPGHSDKHTELFGTFSQGVQRASAGRFGKPADLLSLLEPKEPVIAMLISIKDNRKVYARRVLATLDMLREVEAWKDVVRAHHVNLPEELHLSPKTNQNYSVGDGANMDDQESKAEACVALLHKAVGLIAAQNYMACDRNHDDSVKAFEAFNRAVTWIMESRSDTDDKQLEQLESKDKLLAFVVQVLDNHNLYRNRAAALMMKLLDLPKWQVLADADTSLHARFRDLLFPGEDLQVATTAARPLNLKSMTKVAVSQGNVGLVYVRIVAAYNLMNSDGVDSLSDAFVRVRVGDQSMRTFIVYDDLNPRWDAAPLLFSVPALDTPVHVQVLDSDVVRDEDLGSVSLCVADAPVLSAVSDDLSWPRNAPKLAPKRLKLEKAASGEVELELAFCPGEDFDHPSGSGGPALPRPCWLCRVIGRSE